MALSCSGKRAEPHNQPETGNTLQPGPGHTTKILFLLGEEGQKSLRKYHPGDKETQHLRSMLNHNNISALPTKGWWELNNKGLLEKAMAPHSSILAWKIPWMEEPGGLQFMGSLSAFTFTFHFPALEKEMATHSSVLAWRIPGTGEPGGLPSVGSHRVGHDWSDLAAAAAAATWV